MYLSKESMSIQSTPAPGLLVFPDEFLPEFFKDGKRAAGFVAIEDDGETVTSCQWDEDAYQEWCEANPEPAPAVTQPSEVERLRADIDYLAIMTGVEL